MKSALGPVEAPQEITVVSASTLVEQLNPHQQDLLGAVAFDISYAAIAGRVDRSESTVKVRIMEMYETLGVHLRSEARQVSGGARLLEHAGYGSWENEGFPITRALLDEHGLKLKQIQLMDRLRLNFRDLTLLQLVAEGKTGKEIGSALCLTESTVKSNKLKLYGRIGKDTKDKAVHYLTAPDRTALPRQLEAPGLTQTSG